MMKILKTGKSGLSALFLFLLLASGPGGIIKAQQRISLGIHADPLIGWFASDNKAVMNNGSRPGLNFGLTFNKYFTQNYAFSTGINLITAGGKLVYNDTVDLMLTSSTTVLPGNPVIYHIKYLAVPLGLKLQSNQIGYVTFFTDLGLDPKFVVGGKAEIPSISIDKSDASNELGRFNLGYHVTAGIEYSLGGTTALVLGLGFDSNFVDITKENGDQPVDKILHKMLSFRLGINF
jgi:hypothetical protein